MLTHHLSKETAHSREQCLRHAVSTPSRARATSATSARHAKNTAFRKTTSRRAANRAARVSQPARTRAACCFASSLRVWVAAASAVSRALIASFACAAAAFIAAPIVLANACVRATACHSNTASLFTFKARASRRRETMDSARFSALASLASVRQARNTSTKNLLSLATRNCATMFLFSIHSRSHSRNPSRAHCSARPARRAYAKRTFLPCAFFS